MSLLQSILTDLREKRLWPVALGLIAAIVAVPVALSKSGPSQPTVPPPSTQGAAPNHGTSVSAISVDTTALRSKLRGHAGDPFAQQAASATTTSPSGSTTTPTTTTAATGSSGSTAATASTGSTTSGGTAVPTSPTTTTSTITTTTTTPAPTPTPSPTGLSATEAFQVALSTTNAAGGFNTVDSLERLSIIPSKQQPRLIELGVLKGGHRVLFVVQPGTVLSGPGTCTPGPIDCEILSLGENQIEGISKQTSTGVDSVASFAVTGIDANKQPSAAAADKARQQESTAGRDLISKSTVSALSLFQYEPSLGVVLDLRNLTVGGS
jgi:hypothetical protein